MRVRRDDWTRLVAMTVLGAMPIAFTIFAFVLPNMTTPDFGQNLIIALPVAILTGLPLGYVIGRLDLSVFAAVAYVLLGYLIGLVAYSAPFLFFGLGVVFADLYVMFFLNRTILLLLLFVMGGVIGAALGELVRDSFAKGETATTFPRAKP